MIQYLLKKEDELYELIKKNQFTPTEFNIEGRKYSQKGLLTRLQALTGEEYVDFKGIENTIKKEDYDKILKAYEKAGKTL